MFIHVPGLTDQGVQTEQLTEYVDLFPTLAEAALGETIPSCPRVSKNVTMCTGVCVCGCVCVKTGRARMRDACYNPYPALSTSTCTRVSTDGQSVLPLAKDPNTPISAQNLPKRHVFPFSRRSATCD